MPVAVRSPWHCLEPSFLNRLAILRTSAEGAVLDAVQRVSHLVEQDVRAAFAWATCWYLSAPLELSSAVSCGTPSLSSLTPAMARSSLVKASCCSTSSRCLSVQESSQTIEPGWFLERGVRSVDGVVRVARSLGHQTTRVTVGSRPHHVDLIGCYPPAQRIDRSSASRKSSSRDICSSRSASPNAW